MRYVAVISLLGDTLKSVEVGTSALSNRVIEIMITERHFDRQVTQSLDGRIRNQSAYQVIDQPYDSKVLWRVYAAPKAGPSLDSDYDLKRIRELLQRLAATRHVDAIVLLLAWRAPDYAGHSLGDLPGYGLYRHYFLGVPASTDTYVAFSVHIVWADGATVLGEQTMTAYAKFDDSYWSDGFDGLTLGRRTRWLRLSFYSCPSGPLPLCANLSFFKHVFLFRGLDGWLAGPVRRFMRSDYNGNLGLSAE